MNNWNDRTNPLPPVQNRPLSVHERNSLSWDDKFDRDFERMDKVVSRGASWVMLFGFLNFALWAGVVIFIGWVIIQVMQHFGIV